MMCNVLQTIQRDLTRGRCSVPCSTGQFLVMLFLLMVTSSCWLVPDVLFLLFSFFLLCKVCCLVSNLVSPLLDGLDNVLNNGGLSHRSDWGKDISAGFWESKTGMSDSDMGSIWVRGSKASISMAISKTVSICHLWISDSSSGGNSASKNNESVHGDDCWLGSEELTHMGKGQ